MKYKLITKIGSGTYGLVYASYVPDQINTYKNSNKDDDYDDESIFHRVQRILEPYINNNEKIFAIKKVFNSSENVIRDTTLIEISCMNFLSEHPNVVRMNQEMYNKSNVYVVMEYYPKTLRDIFRLDFDERCKRFPRIAYQICSVLSLIHSLKLCHRDMKPANILIDNNDNVRVADWGLAKILDGNSDTDEVNTLWYRPPELLTTKYKSYECSPTDMWGLGITLLDLVNGYYVFEKSNNVRDMGKFYKKYNPVSTMMGDDYDAVPSNIMEFINKLTVMNPKERMTADEALVYLKENFEEQLQDCNSEDIYSNIKKNVPSLCQGPLKHSQMKVLCQLKSHYKGVLSDITLDYVHNIYTHIVLTNQFNKKVENIMEKYPNETHMDAFETLLHAIAYFSGIMTYEYELDENIFFPIDIPRHTLVKDIFNMLGKNVIFGYTN